MYSDNVQMFPVWKPLNFGSYCFDFEATDKWHSLCHFYKHMSLYFLWCFSLPPTLTLTRVFLALQLIPFLLNTDRTSTYLTHAFHCPLLSTPHWTGIFSFQIVLFVCWWPHTRTQLCTTHAHPCAYSVKCGFCTWELTICLSHPNSVLFLRSLKLLYSSSHFSKLTHNLGPMMSFKQQQQQMYKTKQNKKLKQGLTRSPGWYRTMYVDKTVLDLTGIHLALFPSAGLKVCALHPVHYG